MKYTMRKWTSPKGEVRVYLSGGIIAGGDKVFVVADDAGRPTCKMFLADGNYGYGYRSSFGGNNKGDWAYELVGRALEERGVKFIGATTFAEILALAE